MGNRRTSMLVAGAAAAGLLVGSTGSSVASPEVSDNLSLRGLAVEQMGEQLLDGQVVSFIESVPVDVRADSANLRWASVVIGLTGELTNQGDGSEPVTLGTDIGRLAKLVCATARINGGVPEEAIVAYRTSQKAAGMGSDPGDYTSGLVGAYDACKASILAYSAKSNLVYIPSSGGNSATQPTPVS